MEPKEESVNMVENAGDAQALEPGEKQITSGESQEKGDKIDKDVTDGEHEKGKHAEEERTGKNIVESEHVETYHAQEELAQGEQVSKQHAESEPGQREHVIGEHIEGEHVEGEHVEGKHAAKELKEGEQMEMTLGEHVEGEETMGEQVIGEHGMSEQAESEYTEWEQTEGEQTEGEQTEGEQTEGEQTEGEWTESEWTEGEQSEGLLGEGEESTLGEEKKYETPYEEVVEEEAYVEEPPPDPAAPYNFSDSQELLKEPFELRPDQLAEVEQLWELFQNYNPAYTDLDGFITEKELIYMLKCLLIMTYTPEQLQELITFCVRPPHPLGHITYDQFLRMVTVRLRDFPVEEELRAALQVLDPEKSGLIDREYLREVLSKMGHKMPPKVLESLIKEVDISNDGTIGIEDVVGTMCIDLNREDIIMLRQTLFPSERPAVVDDDD